MGAERNTEPPHLVILGSGFAAVMILKRINLKEYRVSVVSPRNHFLFTPLLPSTTVGTVEFRSIIEPIRKTRKGIDFIPARCREIDPESQTIECEGVEVGTSFSLNYDKLVIAVGAENNTFGIPGVEEHALFLKELVDARNLRERIISCMERADLPGISESEREKLLHFMIVGGGPTGVEFAAELHDLIEESMEENYPGLSRLVKITLYEALPTILGAFDQELRSYTMRHFDRQGIDLQMNKKVKQVGDGRLEFDDGSVEEGGLILWSTGYSPSPLVQSLPFQKDRGRVITDEYLQVPSAPNVYALGDCATIVSQSLPQTAQLAMQAGKYLGSALNRIAKGKEIKPFKFNNLGMLAYVGENKALAEVPKAHLRLRGAITYFFWRSAYLTRLVSLKNKVLVLFDWIKTRVFGRDMSKF
ncbi:MAG: FAD-dependent oxidoreductase [Candidatus Kapaibacterium sp.]